MVTTTVDLDAEGVHKGYLDVPVSLNDSAWSNLRVPIFSFKNGDGPGLLLLGGSHGDEFEGPVALSKLVHDHLEAADVAGRVIILPALNTPAVLQGTRLSPIDGGNMNRAFPGDPRGTATSRIAAFVTRELIPRVDVVLDLHSGGRSLMFVPSTIVPVQKTPEATERILALAAAFDAPLTIVLREPEVAAMIDAEVEAQGKLMLATELGGLGTLTPETTAIALNGVLGVMSSMGIAGSRGRTGPRVVRPKPVRMVRVEGHSHYVYADENGVFEPFADLGDRVAAGATIGRLHRVDRVEYPPSEVPAGVDGILVCKNGQGLVKRGDVLAVIGREIASA